MIVFIRYCIVSLMIAFSLSAESEFFREVTQGLETHYESFLSLDSTWECEGNLIPFHNEQKIIGKLSLEAGAGLVFPSRFQIEISSLDYQMGPRKYTFGNPGQIIELIELKRWQNKPLAFSITDEYPYLYFPTKFKERYKGLKAIEMGTIAGYFAEDLHTLIQIVNSPMKINETIEIDTKIPYKKTKSFLLKEINDTSIILEVIIFIDHQMDAVVHGKLNQIWTISRSNPLQFEMEENGFISTSHQVNLTEMKQAHRIFRKIHSRA